MMTIMSVLFGADRYMKDYKKGSHEETKLTVPDNKAGKSEWVHKVLFSTLILASRSLSDNGTNKKLTTRSYVVCSAVPDTLCQCYSKSHS
jgi:hypothetical protein